MKEWYKKKWILIVGFVCMFIVSGCGIDKSNSDAKEESGAKNSDEIKIGVIIAETGPASTLGSSQANTVKLLQKQLDEAGPIDGKKIKIAKHDYETDDPKLRK